MEAKTSGLTKALLIVRTMSDEQGNAWFVGKDVAVVLGYANPTKASRVHVGEDDKLGSKMDTSFGIKESHLHQREWSLLAHPFEQAGEGT